MVLWRLAPHWMFAKKVVGHGGGIAFREVIMELKEMSSEFKELRSVIIASSMASCYLILENIAAQNDQSVRYEDFRKQWVDLYKSVYGRVSQWKHRSETR